MAPLEEIARVWVELSDSCKSLRAGKRTIVRIASARPRKPAANSTAWRSEQTWAMNAADTLPRRASPPPATSALSPKSRTLHSDRQFPTTHPSVWDQKVVWKQTPAVRMPQRAPGPQTMKMQTFMPLKKKDSSGYGIGGHGGAIQNVPIKEANE